MLVDRSARIWAMRQDDVVGAQALQMRADAADGRPLAIMGGSVLEGSDFASVINGIAVIPVKGPLMRSFSWWAWSYEEILRDVRLAQADARVRGIVLDIDSGGGIAAGVADAAAEIRASGSKPIMAFVGGMAASAAYHIAAAATDDIVLGSGAIVGSIGTVIEYVDLEPMFQKMGARIVRVVAEQSPNKRLDPDSPEGKAEMQALVDAGGAAFVASVAALRGITEDEVLSKFGQGLVFDGAEAIRRGMADRIGTLDGMIAELAGRDPIGNAAPAAAGQEQTQMDWASLTLGQLREHRSDLVAEIAAEHADTIRSEAAAAERARILGLEEVAVEGHEALVAAAKADGKTTPEALAFQIVKADKASGTNYLADRQKADEEAKVPPVDPKQTHVKPGEESTDDVTLKAKWDADANLRAEFGEFATFASYAKAEQAGRARILRKA